MPVFPGSQQRAGLRTLCQSLEFCLIRQVSAVVRSEGREDASIFKAFRLTPKT
jgi:hypothetical protein